MKSWANPHLNKGEQICGDLFIPNTVSGERYSPIKDSKMKIYVCGITPYDSAHIGHLFTYLIFDVLNRAAIKLGANVIYVQNITDIDDPLFDRARKVNRDWREIADEQILNFKSAMEFLRIIPPNEFAAVTEEFETIVESVNRLKDESYRLDSSIYFKSDAKKILEFTKMSDDELFKISGERGGDPGNPKKLNPLDPKIWLTSANDEPIWKSVFGAGRPGWHIECVAIANKYLGGTFDVQGGGKDLLFPHHAFCNELNLSINEEPLARGYLHIELVEYEGDKMSKSLGNLVFLQDLINSGFSADDIRIGLLLQKWDRSWGFTIDVIHEGKELFDFWVNSVSNSYFPNFLNIVDLALNTICKGLNIRDFIVGIGNLEFKNQDAEDLLMSSNFLSDLIGVNVMQNDFDRNSN